MNLRPNRTYSIPREDDPEIDEEMLQQEEAERGDREQQARQDLED